MRGRKPRSVEQQIAEGDPRKKGMGKLQEQLNATPRPVSGLPRCPSHLKGRARSAWKFWSEELAAMDLDKRPDGPMLEGACRQYARAVEADLMVDREGITFAEKYVDEESKEVVILKIRKHPAVEISNRSWTLVKAFCSEFGLSPVSRTRLTIGASGAEGGDDDGLAGLLNQPRTPRDSNAVN